MRPVFIYTLNDPITGIVRYCGQTVDPDVRLRQHVSDVKRNRYHSGYWVGSLLELGLKPVMEILDVVPDDEADFWETEYIQNFRERGFRLTNFSDGGQASMRGKKHSSEAREKMSAAKIGKKKSPETRQRMSAAALGKTISPETRKKLSIANTGKVGPWAGKKFSPEYRAKLSAAHTGKKASPETREKMRVAALGNTNAKLFRVA